MSNKTYRQKCTDEECQEVFEIFCPYEEREVPQQCPTCGASGFYIMSSPMVLTATYLDGQRSKSDRDWQKLKETSKLRVQRAGAKEKDKAKIDAEIARVNGKAPPAPKKRLLDTLLK